MAAVDVVEAVPVLRLVGAAVVLAIVAVLLDAVALPKDAAARPRDLILATDQKTDPAVRWPRSQRETAAVRVVLPSARRGMTVVRRVEVPRLATTNVRQVILRNPSAVPARNGKVAPEAAVIIPRTENALEAAAPPAEVVPSRAPPADPLIATETAGPEVLLLPTNLLLLLP